jgi:5'(3')-deoxyribonucleotidase
MSKLTIMIDIDGVLNTLDTAVIEVYEVLVDGRSE